MLIFPYEELSLEQAKLLVLQDRLPGQKQGSADLADYLSWLQERITTTRPDTSSVGAGSGSSPEGQLAKKCGFLRKRRYLEASRARKCERASSRAALTSLPDKRRLEDIRALRKEVASLLARCQALGGGGSDGRSGAAEGDERGGGAVIKIHLSLKKEKQEAKDEERAEEKDEEGGASEMQEWEAKVAEERKKLEARAPVRKYRFKPLHRTEKHGQPREDEWQEIKRISKELDGLGSEEDEENDDDNEKVQPRAFGAARCRVEALKFELRLVQEERYIQGEVDEHAQEMARYAHERDAHRARARRIELAIHACMVSHLRHGMAAQRPPPRHWQSKDAGGGDGGDGEDAAAGRQRRWQELCGEWAKQLEQVDNADLHTCSVVFFDDGKACQLEYAYTAAAATEKGDISPRTDEGERMRCLGEERAGSEMSSSALSGPHVLEEKKEKGVRGRGGKEEEGAEVAEQRDPVALVSANLGGFYFSSRHFPPFDEIPFRPHVGTI